MNLDKSPAREQIAEVVLKVVRQMADVSEFGLAGSIGPETRVVGDLEFDSVRTVQLLAAVAECFPGHVFPFQNLILRDGEFFDFAVRDLADFVSRELDQAHAP
jgi:acyl carrier protein